MPTSPVQSSLAGRGGSLERSPHGCLEDFNNQLMAEKGISEEMRSLRIPTIRKPFSMHGQGVGCSRDAAHSPHHRLLALLLASLGDRSQLSTHRARLR